MKKLFEKLNKHGVAALCYGVYFAVWLLLCVGVLIFDSIYLNDANANIALEPADFELINLDINPDGTLSTTDGDPQLILKKDTLVRSISYNIKGLTIPSEAVAFYTKDTISDFSVRRRIWPSEKSDGSLLYQFPDKLIYHVRIDPTTIEGETFTLSNLTLNIKRPFYSYFVPSLTSIFYAIIFPGLFASIIVYIMQIFDIFKRKKIV